MSKKKIVMRSKESFEKMYEVTLLISKMTEEELDRFHDWMVENIDSENLPWDECNN